MNDISKTATVVIDIKLITKYEVPNLINMQKPTLPLNYTNKCQFISARKHSAKCTVLDNDSIHIPFSLLGSQCTS